MQNLLCSRRGFVGSLIASSSVYGLAGRVAAQEPQPAKATPEGVPPKAQRIAKLEGEGLHVYGLEHALWLHLDAVALDRGTVTMPRVCASMRSLGWKDYRDAELKFVPEPHEWKFSWQKVPGNASIIEVIFDSAPLLPEDLPPAKPAGDGSVFLHAFEANTHGDKLRFEPQPFKNTVGYWTVPTDYATWQFTINQPGTFAVAVLQGCGEGQGGSEGAITLRQHDEVHAALTFQTLDTGHFQNFRWRHVGMLTIDAEGEHQLHIEPKHIAKNAFCDVRAVHLVRQAT